jgi:hypothetical protein
LTGDWLHQIGAALKIGELLGRVPIASSTSVSRSAVPLGSGKVRARVPPISIRILSPGKTSRGHKSSSSLRNKPQPYSAANTALNTSASNPPSIETSARHCSGSGTVRCMRIRYRTTNRWSTRPGVPATMIWGPRVVCKYCPSRGCAPNLLTNSWPSREKLPKNADESNACGVGQGLGKVVVMEMKK